NSRVVLSANAGSTETWRDARRRANSGGGLAGLPLDLPRGPGHRPAPLAPRVDPRRALPVAESVAERVGGPDARGEGEVEVRLLPAERRPPALVEPDPEVRDRARVEGDGEFRVALLQRRGPLGHVDEELARVLLGDVVRRHEVVHLAA